MTKQLKKAKRAPQISAKTKPYCVTWGTENTLVETRRYATFAEAKKPVLAELDGLRRWCERHNLAGVEAIDEAKREVDAIVFTTRQQRVECLFDERYQMTFVAYLWREQ